MSIKNDIMEAMHDKRKNVSTRCLEAVIYPNGNIKLIVYINIQKSGWVQSQLAKSCQGVCENEFTYDYIKSEVDLIYRDFGSKEINELLNKI